MNKIVYGKVSGTGEFPLDMLRYDVCSPATEQDSYLISRTFNLESRCRGVWEIYVKRILLEHKKGMNTFTYDRWRSFGCRVEETKDGIHGQRQGNLF